MTVPKNDIHFEKAYVVRLSRSQKRLRVFVLLSLFLLIPLATYLGTYVYLGTQERQLSDLTRSQGQLISDLRNQVTSLEQQVVNAEMSSEIDQNSIEQMRQEMVQSQARIEFLGGQINFYQSLMDPNPDKGGVYLQSVDIEPMSEERTYQYNIIIAQRSSNHTRVQGALDLQVIARGQGEADQTFSLNDLTDDQSSLPLGFKFFQQIDGSIRIPEGVVPTGFRVTVKLDGDASPRLDETYAWNS